MFFCPTFGGHIKYTYLLKCLRVLMRISTRTYESVYVVLTEVSARKFAYVLRLPDSLKRQSSF